MKTLKKIRETGLLFAIIAFTPILKIWIPVSASQGSVSFGLSEIYIILFSAYLAYLLLKKKYILEGVSKKIFILILIAGSVSLAISAVHILRGKSVFEFVGAIRNLYACALIYFLYDAKKLQKKELLNGLMIFVLLMSASVFYTTVVYILQLDIPQFLYPDSGYIAVAGIALLPLLAKELKWTLFSKIAMALNIVLALSSSLLKGSRAAWTLSILLLAASFAIMLIKKEKKVVMTTIASVLTSAVLVFSFVTFSGSSLVRAGVFRSSPIIRKITMIYLDNKYDINHISPMSDKGDDINVTDFPDEVTSPDDLQNIISASSGSGKRSNTIRTNAWKAFIGEIKKSPLIGAGLRFLEVKDTFGTVMLVNSHNFILEIASLLGLIGVGAYLLVLAFILVRLIIYKGLFWNEKLLLLLSVGTIFVFAMVQPAISGGITSNILLWSIFAYMLTLAKERNQKQLEAK